MLKDDTIVSLRIARGIGRSSRTLHGPAMPSRPGEEGGLHVWRTHIVDLTRAVRVINAPSKLAVWPTRRTGNGGPGAARWIPCLPPTLHSRTCHPGQRGGVSRDKALCTAYIQPDCAPFRDTNRVHAFSIALAEIHRSSGIGRGLWQRGRVIQSSPRQALEDGGVQAHSR